MGASFEGDVETTWFEECLRVEWVDGEQASKGAQRKRERETKSRQRWGRFHCENEGRRWEEGRRDDAVIEVQPFFSRYFSE